MSTKDETFEREKWEHELRLRERDADLKQADHDLRVREVNLRVEEASKSGWKSPLVLAVAGAALAAAGGAVTALVNGKLARELEQDKAEQARILEVVKTGAPRQAAENLKFLLESGLITSKTVRDGVAAYIAKQEPGTGVSLPAVERVFGDGPRPVEALAADSILRKLSQSVGRLAVRQSSGMQYCTGFLIAESIAVVPNFCAVAEQARMSMSFPLAGKEKEYRIKRALPGTVSSAATEPSFAFLHLEGKPGAVHGMLVPRTGKLLVGERLSLVAYTAGGWQGAVAGGPGCSVAATDGPSFTHACPTGPGSSGAPLIDDTGLVVGMHMLAVLKRGKTGLGAADLMRALELAQVSASR